MAGGTEPAFFRRVWDAAEAAFNERCAACGGLVPGTPRLTVASRTFGQILRKVEHAVRVWDSKYGPLTLEQWAYAASLIEHALAEAGAQTGGDRYAFFNTELLGLLNHEKVQDGFRRRGGEPAPAAVDVLGSVFREVET